MHTTTAIFLRSFVVFVLLITFPVSVRSADSIIVGVAGPAINMVYSFVARDTGFFSKYGLDARIVVFDAGSILAQAALSGEVKISVSSGPATIASRSQGADTIIVAACVNILPYSIVAAKGITGNRYRGSIGIKEIRPRPGQGCHYCSARYAA